MIEYEKVCMASRPDWIVVVGDVNSTLACALVGAKLLIPVAHLEAGLRSGDRTMPEEINRIVTDSIADVLWTPSADGNEHLAREGVAADKVELVGNIMLDSFELLAPKIRAADVAAQARARDGQLRRRDAAPAVERRRSRPARVDRRRSSSRCARSLPLVFPVHPRTRQRLEEFGLDARSRPAPAIRMTEPLSYIEFMSLVVDCRFALTDSGGVQEETSYLGIPCLTLRENTERPVTVTLGTNRLVKVDGVEKEVERVLRQPLRTVRLDSVLGRRTSGRVVASLRRRAVRAPYRRLRPGGQTRRRLAS